MIRAFYCGAFALATLSALSLSTPACDVYGPELLGPGGGGGAGGAPVACPPGCDRDDAGDCLSLDGIVCQLDAGGAS